MAEHDLHTIGTATFEEVSMIPRNILLRNQAVALGDIRYTSKLKSNLFLECTLAGTTGSTMPSFASVQEGDTVTDGSAIWTIRDARSTQKLATARTLTIKDSSSSNAGTPVSFDGSQNVDLLLPIHIKGTAVEIDNAGSHNALFRGKDLTAYWESGDMSAAIADGSFEDIYPGDYITKSITVDGTTYTDDWIVGDLNYHKHRGDTETTANHILVFPRGTFGAARMNATDTTSGGFLGSEMWTTTLPKYKNAIKTAFGANHVLKHREILTNAVDINTASGNYSAWKGAASNSAWADVEVNIFNEVMVLGISDLSSSTYDVGDCCSMVAAICHDSKLHFTLHARNWLRDVIHGATFAHINGDITIAHHDGSSDATARVRPYFLLY